jgi:hypothetical protein
MSASTSDTLRRLNHMEMLYRPGERALAGRVFELLGMRVVDTGGEWLYAFVDSNVDDYANNACYASEVTPEQLALEHALDAAMTAASGLPAAVESEGPSIEADLGTAARQYLRRIHDEPQRTFHFGIRFYSRDDFEAALDRIRGATAEDDLSGRVALSGVYYPDEPGAYAPNMIQAFVKTDVVASGLLAFGQHIELQWHIPKGEPFQR